MLILAMDTSTQFASVAVARDGALLCEYALNHKKTHSQKILPLIDRALHDLERSIEDVDVFAVGTGPGSFTGLRIGVAMAKAFAHTLGKKIIGESTLAMLAANVPYCKGLVIPLMFARADECFTAWYRGGERIVADCVMTREELLARLEEEKGPILFVGDGAERWRIPLSDRLGARAQFAPMQAGYHRSASLAALAYERAQAGRFDDEMTLAPAYLRPSQAEREFG